MNKIYEPLFTPWKIRDVEIKNRIVLCPMGGNVAVRLDGAASPRQGRGCFLPRAREE